MRFIITIDFCMFFLFLFCFDEAVSPAPVEEAIVAEASNIIGDRGNPSYIKQLNQLNDEAASPAPVEEAIVADTSNITGDRGNPSYIKQLNQLNENTQNQGNPPIHTNSNLYHPQRSCGKVMFSQASVILFMGGGGHARRGMCVAGWGRHVWWGACMAEGHA